ncbi:hypothetical protein ACF3DV_15415 [Chlorogloeopsis fritschii PCC 9212]|uniref:Uncharacterized protein n=1 Tax=Chlorogloeopsis fritschii PCC 6912 TaxID=211165 RepID=A0A433NKV9_CHLFR|nr:hypothetical protein [Chlorogloeopsis fritschii]MBF2009609.1 hypothetical protein [Chlorogloeopsis fritschii C42_A2020_084]RUR83429.1 hypothetical protein PCC6912_22620 [Chlorogloeopsis fritschii PCC 6912]
MHTPEEIQIGAKVLILSPAYVAGRIGVVCGREVLSDNLPSDRWLIQVDSENIVVSLTRNDFQVLPQWEKDL